jgi:hypothetical protein
LNGGGRRKLRRRNAHEQSRNSGSWRRHSDANRKRKRMRGDAYRSRKRRRRTFPGGRMGESETSA